MERGDNEVAGEGRCDGDLGGLSIAELADDNHIGALTEHRPKRRGEAVGVGANLPLRDAAADVVMDILDRVFDGDDVAGVGLVDPVDEPRDGGALARARCAGDEDQAARLRGEGGHSGEVADAEKVDVACWDRADGDGEAALLAGDVEAEAAAVRHRDAGIHILQGREAGPLRRREQLGEQRIELCGGCRRQVDVAEPAGDAGRRRLALRDKEVGGTPALHGGEESCGLRGFSGHGRRLREGRCPMRADRWRRAPPRR